MVYMKEPKPGKRRGGKGRD